MLSFALYLFSLIVLLGYITILFFIAQIKKDNSIIDIGYGLGFILTSGLLTIKTLNYGPLSTATLLILFLITVWGLRLSFRIYKKRKGKSEDFRYLTWRKSWMKKGYRYYLARAYLQIFILQGIVISIVMLPFTLSLTAGNTIHFPLLYGLIVFLVGFYYEVVGDRQLDTFIKNRSAHSESIMKKGLWKYTRHPNYFGESTMWIGITLIAIASQASPISLLSPLLITYLLLFVSGVPMLEKRWEGIPEWEVYKKKTSMFFPLPPKHTQ